MIVSSEAELKVIFFIYAFFSIGVVTIMLFYGIMEKIRLNKLITAFKELPIEIVRDVYKHEQFRSENSARNITVRYLRKQRELIDIHLARLGDDE